MMIVKIIFSVPFRTIEFILSQFEKKSSAEAGARGCGQCCTITLLHMNRLNKTKSAIFVFLMCSLLPDDLHSDFFLFHMAAH